MLTFFIFFYPLPARVSKDFKNACKTNDIYNLKILAEGVELPQQFELLKQLGCDEIQGYLVSIPLDEKTFIEFCKKQ